MPSRSLFPFTPRAYGHMIATCGPQSNTTPKEGKPSDDGGIGSKQPSAPPTSSPPAPPSLPPLQALTSLNPLQSSYDLNLPSSLHAGCCSAYDAAPMVSHRFAPHSTLLLLLLRYHTQDKTHAPRMNCQADVLRNSGRINAERCAYGNMATIYFQSRHFRSVSSPCYAKIGIRHSSQGSLLSCVL